LNIHLNALKIMVIFLATIALFIGILVLLVLINPLIDLGMGCAVGLVTLYFLCLDLAKDEN
jgi:hypothetical protein